MLPNAIGAALFKFHERPTSALLKAYCASLALLAALPFSFSLDATRPCRIGALSRIIPDEGTITPTFRIGATQ